MRTTGSSITYTLGRCRNTRRRFLFFNSSFIPTLLLIRLDIPFGYCNGNLWTNGTIWIDRTKPNVLFGGSNDVFDNRDPEEVKSFLVWDVRRWRLVEHVYSFLFLITPSRYPDPSFHVPPHKSHVYPFLFLSIFLSMFVFTESSRSCFPPLIKNSIPPP